MSCDVLAAYQYSGLLLNSEWPVFKPMTS